MEDVIRKAKDALYTFTSTEESRTTTVTETNTDPKTGKVTVTETEVTEIWKIYTIVYNGEAILRIRYSLCRMNKRDWRKTTPRT